MISKCYYRKKKGKLVIERKAFGKTEYLLTLPDAQDLLEAILAQPSFFEGKLKGFTCAKARKIQQKLGIVEGVLNKEAFLDEVFAQ